MLISKRTRRNIILFFLIAVLINLIDMFLPIDFPIHSIEILSWGMLMIYWGASVWMRVTDKRIRTLLLCIMAGFVALYLFQLFKYQFLYDMDTLSRHFWYVYYIPLIFIPVFSFMVSRSIGSRRVLDDITDRVMLSLASVLCVFTLSNDLHECVWTFAPGFANWGTQYSHGWGFYIICAWIICLMLTSFYEAVKRGAFGESRRYMFIPLTVLIIGALFGGLDTFTDFFVVMGRHIFKFQQLYSLIMIVFWESFIQTGVIASNRDLDMIFERSGIDAYVCDKAEPLQTDIKPDGAIRLHCREVSGGYVYWKDDISRLNELKNELFSVQENLTQEGEILRSQKAFKEKELSVKTRTEIYDRLSIALKDKTDMMEQLLESDLTLREKLKSMAVIGAYIKRYSNLVLLAESEAESRQLDYRQVCLSLDELKLSMEESIRYMRLPGAGSDYMPDEDILKGKEEKLPAEEILSLYHSFEAGLEKAIFSTLGHPEQSEGHLSEVPQ
ncbi:MAG: hypothetical protein IJM34_04595 [Lachnospiraceae bacterium]|nr:hypothetical protein [Lachnospiraceae bacterium]